jgi:hypothetical protein
MRLYDVVNRVDAAHSARTARFLRAQHPVRTHFPDSSCIDSSTVAATLAARAVRLLGMQHFTNCEVLYIY